MIHNEIASIFFNHIEFIKNIINKINIPLSYKKSIGKKTRSILKQISIITKENKSIDQKTYSLYQLLIKEFLENSTHDSKMHCDFMFSLSSYIIRQRLNSIDHSGEKEILLKDFLNIREHLINHEYFYRVVGSTGLYRIALLLRDDYLHNSMRNFNLSKRSERDLFTLFLGSIDLGDFDLAEQIITSIKSRPFKLLPIRDMELYYNLIKGNRSEALRLAKRKYSKIDKDFFDFVYNKSIAIVGPAQSCEMLKDEIDSYDIVIRLNYRGSEKMPPEKEFGSKVDISYYNSVFSADISNYENKDFFDDLDYIIFKDLKHHYQKVIMKKHQHVRKWISFNRFVFGGKINMIQNVVLDLLTFEPSKIKIFKANLYLTENYYYPGYQISNYNNDQYYNWLQHWYTHDIVTHFNLTKSLWKNGLIEVDNYLEYVLEHNCEDYIRNMDDIYS